MMLRSMVLLSRSSKCYNHCEEWWYSVNGFLLIGPVDITVLSAIAAPYHLCTRATKRETLTPELIECMNRCATAQSVNVHFNYTAIDVAIVHITHVPGNLHGSPWMVP
eukprot:c23033_g1_i1 orf=673-996(-)